MIVILEFEFEFEFIIFIFEFKLIFLLLDFLFENRLYCELNVFVVDSGGWIDGVGLGEGVGVLFGDDVNGIFVDGGVICNCGVLGWNFLRGELFFIKFFIFFVIWVNCFLVVVLSKFVIFVEWVFVFLVVEIDLYKVFKFKIFFFVDNCFLGLCVVCLIFLEIMELGCWLVEMLWFVIFGFLWF